MTRALLAAAVDLAGRHGAAAVDLAGRHGAAAVEGFPLAADVRRPPSEAYVGVEQVFTTCDFAPVARPTPNRVVMRRQLG